MSQVTVIPKDFPTRFEPVLAAAYAVRRFGSQAIEIEVCAKREAWDVYWAEVDRLINGGTPSPEDAERVEFMLKAQGFRKIS